MCHLDSLSLLLEEGNGYVYTIFLCALIVCQGHFVMNLHHHPDGQAC